MPVGHCWICDDTEKFTAYPCGGASDSLEFTYDLARRVMRQKQEYLVWFLHRCDVS
jgi:hypothetical protein